jgi:hypothetical protein
MVAPSAEEVRRHLCYELKWMLRAVARFDLLTHEIRAAEARGEAPAEADIVALQDSALLHARNLIEFASASSDASVDQVEWALSDILGTKRRKVPTRLRVFLNDRVVHLGDLRTTDARWPKDVDGNAIDNSDDERLSKVAVVVLQLLKPKHRTTTEETDAGAAYVELLDRAHEYLDQRTPDAFDRLTCSGEPMPAAKRTRPRKR